MTDMTASTKQHGPASFKSRMPTIAELTRWVAEARPGARLIYGRGFSAVAAAGHQMRDKVQALHALGLVTPHVTRDRSGDGPSLVYLVQRTRKPFVRGMKL